MVKRLYSKCRDVVCGFDSHLRYMDEKEECPHCKADLRSGLIPEEYLRAGYYGGMIDDGKGGKVWDGKPRYFYHTIVVEISHIYDGGLFYQCPFCGGRWHRWKPGTRQHAAASVFVGPEKG